MKRELQTQTNHQMQLPWPTGMFPQHPHIAKNQHAMLPENNIRPQTEPPPPGRSGKNRTACFAPVVFSGNDYSTDA